ncbi:MAG: hypothetical protein R3F13_05925 [Prosthecobacter sp.]
MSRLSLFTKNKGVRTALPIAALAFTNDIRGTQNVKAAVVGETEASEAASPALIAVDSTANLAPMQVTLLIEEWTDQLESRFIALAKKDALGKAGSTEIAELEQLEHLRNRLKSPMKFDELVWHAQHEEATQKLLSAMQDYLSFCAGPSWTGAKRNR